MLIRKYLKGIYDLLVQPRSSDVEIQRQEFVLNMVLLGIIVLALWSEGYVAITWLIDKGVYEGIPIQFFTLFLLLFVFSLTLSRRGYPRIASYILLSLFFLGATYGAYVWGPDLQPVLISYILIIFMAGILINGTAGFIATSIIGIVIIVLAHLQISGVLKPELYWKREQIEIFDMIEIVFMLFIITTVSWLSNHEHEKSLLRARTSEQALKEERDLLEIKVSERTEELKRAQAENISQFSRFAEVGKLSAGLFHDLIGPLSAVALNLSMLDGTVNSDVDTIKDQVNRAVKASKRMDSFIGAVRKQIHVQEFEEIFLVNETVEESISLFHYITTKAQISVNFISTEKIYMFGNPIKFHQIVSNLISNAINSYEDQPLPTERKTISIDLSQKKKILTLMISDKGKGISASNISKIFDLFFTTRAASKGMGMGLYMVKEIVEKEFEGTINVHSKIHEGTTFIIKIPLKNERIP